MKLRVLVLLLALFVGVFAVNAQSDCMGLADADCQVLQTAMAQTATATSYNVDFALDFSLEGLGGMDPSMAGQVISLNVDGTGSVVGGAGTNVPFNFGSTMDVATNSPDGETNNQGFEVYLVDDIIYVENEDGSFQGITTDDIATQIQSAMAGAPFDPSALMGGMTGSDMSGFPEFTTFTRNANEDMMGQSVIPFQFKADFTKLFQSPEFSSMLTQITSSMGSADPQAAQMGAMVGMILPGLAGDMQMTQYVGAEDAYLHGLNMDLNLSLDLAAMGATEPIVLTVHFEVNMHDFGDGAPVTAPTNVTMAAGS